MESHERVANDSLVRASWLRAERLSDSWLRLGDGSDHIRLPHSGSRRPAGHPEMTPSRAQTARRRLRA